MHQRTLASLHFGPDTVTWAEMDKVRALKAGRSHSNLESHTPRSLTQVMVR
jgi:hypothetical protein